MYGWLLESVQHFIIQECGEEIWEAILRNAGAKNTVFCATQQYPDALMFKLASALAQFVSKDPNNPASTTPASNKPKPSWRSASVHADTRNQNSKCLFSATNALTAVTKREIEAYNSSEEIRCPQNSTISINKIKECEELDIRACPLASMALGVRDRRSIGVTLEQMRHKEVPEPVKQCAKDACQDNNKDTTKQPLKDATQDNSKDTTKQPVKDATQDKTVKDSVTSSPTFDNARRALAKTAKRKTSCTLAVDVYRRRGSGAHVRPRFNSLTLVHAEKLYSLKDKFGTPEKVMHFFGRCFVKFFSNYGYDKMIKATGRYFCTFLQSVDSIHQRMRFTFPRMKSPRMQLTRAHIHGAELVYSSTRIGFTHYLMGQLYEIAEDIFSLKLKVSVLKESMEGSYYVAVLRLEFDNSDYVNSLMLKKSLPCHLPPVPASLLLQLFPFGVMLDRKMKIMMAGDKLVESWGGPYNRLEKSPASDILRLRKPKVSFTWDKVVCMQTMMFELELMRWRSRALTDSRRGSQGARAILLKGPIYFLEEIDALIFLCSPIFNDLQELQQAGLCLADMNGHGLSREMLFQGWQHLSLLELMFEKAETRSMNLEKSYTLLDQWKTRSDQLLYSMIPKTIADLLRAGKSVKTETFDVTIMFCGIQLKDTGTRADVMQTVSYMNDLYSRIDRLLDKHEVYKVETVGTVYMVVSGAPERSLTHASAIASAALAVSSALPMLTIGVHTGTVVPCVLGIRQPRYCLVGDTVNTASRMQTTSETGRIQISAQVKAELPPGRFRLRRRGLIKVKGKGIMETFWLEGEIEDQETQDEALQLFSSICGDE